MANQTAKLNDLRMTPRKVRAIADTIRGLSVNEAEAQLMFQKNRASKPILKLLRSAVSNAKNNKLNPDNMIIGKITVDQGQTLKRMMMRARGSASAIQKKSSHITLVLSEVENPKEKKYTIVVAKKAKKPERGGKKKKEPKDKDQKVEPEVMKNTDKKKGTGFFQKTFRRKSI